MPRIDNSELVSVSKRALELPGPDIVGQIENMGKIVFPFNDADFPLYVSSAAFQVPTADQTPVMKAVYDSTATNQAHTYTVTSGKVLYVTSMHFSSSVAQQMAVRDNSTTFPTPGSSFQNMMYVQIPANNDSVTLNFPTPVKFTVSLNIIKESATQGTTLFGFTGWEE